jgi:hypothetical protein
MLECPRFAAKWFCRHNKLGVIFTSRENRFYFESYRAADSSSRITNYHRTRRAPHALIMKPPVVQQTPHRNS